MGPDLKSKLLAICSRYAGGPQGMVVEEPYIPFVPEQWNGVLIVSEAQNLAHGFNDYVDRLRGRSPEEKMLRLYPEVRRALYPGDDRRSGELGVAPWDDGPLQLAASAVWDQQPSVFAVANAVLWSEATAGGANARPAAAREPSGAIWSEFLAVLKPNVTVAVGRVAYDLLQGVGAEPVRWLSASPRVGTILSRLGESSELMRRFPEVRRAQALFEKEAPPAWIAYACHVVAATPRRL
jgi:hypothetical protein